MLDRFRLGDDEALAAIQSGTIEWTSVVAERWTQQLVGTLADRLRQLSKTLQTALNRANHHEAVSNAMLTARRGLIPLRAFVQTPAIPDQVRSHLTSELSSWAAETQKSLERSAEAQRHSDYGRLLKTFRDQPLNAALREPAPMSPAPSTTISLVPLRGRRVIL